MKSSKVGPALGAGVITIAVLSTLSALSMPVPERREPGAVIAAVLALLLTHAGIYALGDRIRRRFTLTGYAAAQAGALFAIALAKPPSPLTLVLFVVAVAELVTLAGSAWDSVRITTGAVAVLVLGRLLTSDLYRATTDGVVLAATGLVAHAIAGLLSRPVVIAAQPVPVAPVNQNSLLSARETEVLRALVNGARNSDIATTLGISERTVKAHLGSIYQKLGVSTRSAAVAAALQRKLV